MSYKLSSTDSNATITADRPRQWRAVDLFCPHPHLLALARTSKPAPRPVLSQLLDNPGLLSTTAFRIPRPTQPLRITQPLWPTQPLRPNINASRARLPPLPPQPQPSPQPQPRRPAPEFRSQVITLLELWRDVPPSQYHLYAARLRPVMSTIFQMYLDRELELTHEELAEVRTLGRTILEHSRGPRTDLGQQAEVPRGVPRAAAEVGIPVDAILGNLDQQTNLARSNAVRHRTTSRGGPGAYSTNESIQAWMGGM